MDEQSFDKLIKDKLQDYRDPRFDEDAFGTFRDRIAVATKLAGSSANIRNVTVISIMILLTGLNFLITFYKTTDATSHAMTQKVDSLTTVIAQLQSSLANQKSRPGDNSDKVANTNSRVTAAVASGEKRDEEPPVERRTIEMGETAVHRLHVPLTFPVARFVRLQPIQNHSGERKINHVSAKTKTELEKHYFSGLGINAGPQVELGLLQFENASAGALASAGFGVDWIFSPHLSMETNVHAAIASNPLSVNDPHVMQMNYAGSGDLVSVTQVHDLFHSAALFKYRQWLNDRDQVYLKLGVSQYMMIGGKYKFEYLTSGYHDPDDRGSITQIKKIDGVRSFATLGAVSLGFSRQLHHAQKIDVSAFYEGGLNLDKNRAQVFGIQTSLWFHLK